MLTRFWQNKHILSLSLWKISKDIGFSKEASHVHVVYVGAKSYFCSFTLAMEFNYFGIGGRWNMQLGLWFLYFRIDGVSSWKLMVLVEFWFVLFVFCKLFTNLLENLNNILTYGKFEQYFDILMQWKWQLYTIKYPWKKLYIIKYVRAFL